MSDKSQCTVRQAPFSGWDAYYLENGLVRLVAVPVIGGRIMAYDLGDYPFLFVDPDLAGKTFTAEERQGDGSLAAWKNYGGDKTWPAPQGWDNEEQWHGPPDPVLDSGHYRVTRFEDTDDSANLRLVSPPDPRTGVQITRDITLHSNSSRVTLQLFFRNVKEEPIRWSIWDVVQLRAERPSPAESWEHDPHCVVTTPLNPNSRFTRGFNVMFGATDNPQWSVDREQGLFMARYLWEIGKVGIDSPGGWIAFSQGREGYAFVERFAYDPDAVYPDDGATVECWTVGAGQVDNLDYEGSGIYLMETEVLGPLQQIAPGESSQFTIEWAAAGCSGPVVMVGEAGCAARPLALETGDGQMYLRGQFGVFDQGELLYRAYDAGGTLLSEKRLGAVDPRQELILDQEVPYLPQMERLALVVRTGDGEERLLDEHSR
jgi:hypothetical protein